MTAGPSTRSVSRLGEIDVDEMTEIVQDAWLCRASKRRAEVWLAEHRT